MNRFFKAIATGAAVFAMAAGLVACGDDDSAVTAAASSTVSGSVVKGPVSGSTVTFYAVDASGAKGASLGSTTTGSGGTYSATLAYAGAVLVEVTGGTYVDEASGTSKTFSETMRVMVTATSGGTVTGIVTPLTTAAYSLGQVGGSANVSAATYAAAITSIATQFNLTGVNLVTSVPAVSGTTNAYGQVLRAVSQYVLNGGSLNTFLSWASPASFSVAFSNAYGTINGGTVSYSFNNNSVVISGTGAGGGTGTCGVNIKGTVTAQGFSVPLDMNFCISGIAAGSCTAGNSSLSQGLSGNPALSGGTNLQYTYSATCAGNATNITLQ